MLNSHITLAKLQASQSQQGLDEKKSAGGYQLAKVLQPISDPLPHLSPLVH